MKIYQLLDVTAVPSREIGWIEFHPEEPAGEQLVFSDVGTREICCGEGGWFPDSDPEKFLAAAQTGLASSGFVRLVPSES